jgi:ATP-dependent Lon protease
MTETKILPVLPLRDIVVFPHMIVPLFVGRDKSVAALEAAMAADKEIFLVAQLDPPMTIPVATTFTIGVSAEVMQLLKLPDGTVRVLVAGKERGKLETMQDAGGYLDRHGVTRRSRRRRAGTRCRH